MEKEIGKITATRLGWEDHGIFTCSLVMDYGGGGQVIGNYALDDVVNKDDGGIKRRGGTSYGLEFIMRLMEACGVRKWEDLEGKTIYVLQGEGGTRLGSSSVVGVENLPTEPGKRFIFADLRDEFTDSKGAA